MGGKTRRSAGGKPGANAPVRATPPAPRPRRRWLTGCALSTGAIALLGTGGALLLVLIGILGGWLFYDRYVVKAPGEHLSEASIRRAIAQESSVYYRDGETRFGVFFEDQHREYLSWEEVPHAWVFAIIAAEDGGFWTHTGISPKHIGRAVFQNLTSGGVVSGGSTLTQQTAKNLFNRPDRSLKSKGVELLNALRLEAHYEKSDILTFYANQFHVTGNGRGLGIASRYFFDKEPSELGLVECAYLAGLVKGPSNYDPYLGDEKKRTRAKERAHDRVGYVLRRLVTEDPVALAGPLPPEEIEAIRVEAQALLDGGWDIPFQRGTFRFDRNAVLDEIERRLGEEPIAGALAAAGVDDPATAGLVVVTTLDPDAQREATYGLWHHLTEVGTMLEGLGAAAFVLDSKPPPHAPDRAPVRHEFRTAVAGEHIGENGDIHLKLDLGGVACTADRDAMARIALMAYRGERKSKSAKVSGAWIDTFAAAIPDGSVVLVSVRDVGEGGAICDLEARPTLQGASIVLEHGQIRAMVGGNDNRNFNRAEAPRQMGSTWKPLVYHAALELGWNPTDALGNAPAVFPWRGVFYYPSSDHAPAPQTSISWAGVNSENIASVWLLYHLTDRLTPEQTAQVAAELELAPAEGESREDWQARLEEAGVQSSAKRVEEAWFLAARGEVAAGMLTAAHPEDAPAVGSMLYGFGFEAERRQVEKDREDGSWKLAALDQAWLRQRDRAITCAEQHRRLSDGVARGEVPPQEQIADLSVLVEGDLVRVACGVAPVGYGPPTSATLSFLFPVEAEVDVAPVEEEEEEPEEAVSGGKRRGKKRDQPAPKPRAVTSAVSSWSTEVATYNAGPRLEADADLLVDGRLHLSTLQALERAFEARKQDTVDPWAPETLYQTQDFRVLLGIRYVVALAGQYGVRSELREGLPLPLGASEITLEEAASIYEGLITGSAWDFPGEAGGQEVGPPAAPTLLVAEVRDIDGNVLYAAHPVARQVASPETAAMTADILRNVVVHGTGRRAADAVKVGKVAVPVAGKTGTTNDYKNAAFLGYVPVVGDGGWTLDGAWIVGAYVGYDDNRSMERGDIALAGANGALPVWIGAARGLAEHGLLGAPPKGLDGMLAPDGLVRIDVETATGLAGVGGSVLTRPGGSITAAEAVVAVELPPSERAQRRRARAAAAGE